MFYYASVFCVAAIVIVAVVVVVIVVVVVSYSLVLQQGRLTGRSLGWRISLFMERQLFNVNLHQYWIYHLHGKPPFARIKIV